MKSSYTINTKTTSTYTKGTAKPQYQPKTITQAVKKDNTANIGNKRANPQTNISKPTSSYTRSAQNQTQSKQSKPAAQAPKITIDMSKYLNKKSNTKTDLSKKDDKPKWQNNRTTGTAAKAAPQNNYDRRNIGDTQTKVQTMQEGDYLIKVTTTRKVIDKGSYDKRNGTGYRGGNYGRK